MLSPLCCISVLFSPPPSILCDFGSCGILAFFGIKPFTQHMGVALFSDSYSSNMILIVFLRDLSYEKFLSSPSFSFLSLSLPVLFFFFWGGYLLSQLQYGVHFCDSSLPELDHLRSPGVSLILIEM